MRKLIILLAVVLLFLSCEDFLTGDLLDNNPNKVSDVDQVSVEALFVGSQVTMYGFMEGYLARLVSMFMQQLAGQLGTQVDDYNCAPLDWRLDNRWSDIYGTGGLVDLRIIQNRSLEQEKFMLLGMSQMWESLLFSTAADLWGALPYSEAVDARYTEPLFDSQRDIHDDVLALIEDAIVNIGQGQVFTTLNDFSFNGNQSKWIAAAHTLRARILLNWAEVDGTTAYQAALNEAQNGIADESGASDWKPLHTSTGNNEESVWFQFFDQNQYAMGAGTLLADLLKQDNDGRLTIYFDPQSAFNDTIVGLAPGNPPPPYASQLNKNTVGSETWGVPWVSWHENQFIIAECQYQLGQEPDALITLNHILEILEARWQEYDPQCQLPRYQSLSGANLLEAIMNEKYKALFLNMQTLSDWRRTGYPHFVDLQGNSTECDNGIPRRFPYPELEKKTNSHVPQGDSIFDRVEYDPY
ncbi:MAG: SusD/RagB family nutrient-binding outer membrane lipoprotein [Candidatus Marinimicrobia bacterium]|nr:SusD/RagB family nutrient-binding outer membrane lipoprotein [Candidatus Neomarinimicrobiota bacterium]